MTNELQSRRSALANILNQGAGYLGEQDRLALQDKIAQIDASLGLNAQNNQFTLGSTGLANQNRQFYDQLGANISGGANTLDNVLMQLFGRG
jgi:hypothetical protein